MNKFFIALSLSLCILSAHMNGAAAESKESKAVVVAATHSTPNIHNLVQLAQVNLLPLAATPLSNPQQAAIQALLLPRASTRLTQFSQLCDVLGKTNSTAQTMQQIDATVQQTTHNLAAMPALLTACSAIPEAQFFAQQLKEDFALLQLIAPALDQTTKKPRKTPCFKLEMNCIIQ